MASATKRRPLWMTAVVSAILGALVGAWLEVSPNAEALYQIQPLAFYSFIAALAAAVIQTTWRIGKRFRSEGKNSAPLRSMALLFAATLICSAGFAAELVALNVFWEMESLNPFNSASSIELAFGLVSVAAGVCLWIASGAAFGYLDTLSQSTRQWSMRASVVSLFALPLWSAVCLPVMRSEAVGGHAAGAGVGAFLIGIAIPGAVFLLVAAQIVILRSLPLVAELNSLEMGSE
jgi:hypothetical protein